MRLLAGRLPWVKSHELTPDALQELTPEADPANVVGSLAFDLQALGADR
jgi:hypothetical protein